ncbi:HNH endonuclease (plasmid) [Burkholderia pyrrocinia]|uniref:HNH endonuclease n=1 Tax=Burkholderia pyrrocinia TaxID=60550 RepID=UPI0038B6312E
MHDLPRKWLWLAKAQKGYCAVCGGSLFNGEELHRHHVIRRKDGGTDDLANQRLVHLFCHQQEHRSREVDDADLEAFQFA